MGEREPERGEPDRVDTDPQPATSTGADKPESAPVDAEPQPTTSTGADEPEPQATPSTGADEPGPAPTEPEPQQPPPAAAAAPVPVQGQGWGAGRIALVVIGSILALVALVAAAGGVTALVFDQTQRDAAGFLMTDTKRFSTPSYALVSDSYKAGTASDWVVVGDLLGTVRIKSTSTRPVFVGIATESDVEGYLGGVEREVAKEFDADPSDFQSFPGQSPPTVPGAQHFWAASTSGSGVQSLIWKPQNGSWRVVVMDPQASAGVSTQLSAGAKFPDLVWIGLGLLLGGLAVLGLAVWMIYAGAREPAT